MKEVLEFLNKVGVYYLATAEGAQPRVRPMGFVMEHEGRLVFCTGNDKKMYRQMKENPRVEFCAFDGQGNTLRLSGEVVFATTEEAQKKALESAPVLRNIYSVGDGVFELFYLEGARAVFSNMQGESRETAL